MADLRVAVDFGTTNSVVAVAEQGSVRVVPLPDVTRATLTANAEPSPLVPTAVFVTGRQRRSWPYFWRAPGFACLVGRAARERNYDGQSPAFAQSFKRFLGDQPHRPVARTGANETVSAREAATLFLRETLALAARQTGARRKISDLTIPVPVGYYETYRAELAALARRLGVSRLRTLDEPVAAALGYGVNVARGETLLVVDWGGGTLNLAAVQLGPDAANEAGAAPILAKHMVRVGGDDVDRFLLTHLLGSDLAELPDWQHDALWEVTRLKEAGGGPFRWRGVNRTLTPEDFARVLDENGLYDSLRTVLDDIKAQLGSMAVDEVLLTGGSTLLPGVAAVVDEAFPRAVVRHDPAWVFTAVATGAARFAAGIAVDDFVYHDYALAVQNPQTHQREYELLVPRRTRYPTRPDFATRYYADYAGMDEMRFRVCEIGRLGQAAVAWQAKTGAGAAVYWTPQADTGHALAVELNPDDAPLALSPPGRGTSPRLRVTYSINADRWLCTTVEDLVRKQILRDNEPVARLR